MGEMSCESSGIFDDSADVIGKSAFELLTLAPFSCVLTGNTTLI